MNGVSCPKAEFSAKSPEDGEQSLSVCAELRWSKTNKDSLSSVVITYWAPHSYHLTHPSSSASPCSHRHKGLAMSPKHQYRRANGAYLNTCYNLIVNYLRPKASYSRGPKCPWCQNKDKFINYFQVKSESWLNISFYEKKVISNILSDK